MHVDKPLSLCGVLFDDPEKRGKEPKSKQEIEKEKKSRTGQ